MPSLTRIVHLYASTNRLVTPEFMDAEKFEAAKPLLEKSIKALEAVGAKLEQIKPEDTHGYAHFLFKGYRFGVPLDELTHPDKVAQVTRKWAQVVEVLEHFEGIPDPFYGNLNSVLIRNLGRSKGLAYNWITQMVRSKGKRWHMPGRSFQLVRW